MCLGTAGISDAVRPVAGIADRLSRLGCTRLIVAPENARELLIAHINRAETNLDLAVMYISDNEVDPTSVDTPFGRDRWSASLVHDQDLPWGFRLKSDARFVSDNQYPLDFDEFRVVYV